MRTWLKKVAAHDIFCGSYRSDGVLAGWVGFVFDGLRWSAWEGFELEFPNENIKKRIFERICGKPGDLKEYQSKDKIKKNLESGEENPFPFEDSPVAGV